MPTTTAQEITVTVTNTVSAVFTREQAKASDATLVELIEAKRAADRKLGSKLDSLRYIVGDRQTGWGRDRRWGLKPQEAFDKAVALAATDETYKGREAAEAVDNYKSALAVYESAAEAVTVQNREWVEHGQWSRFLAVVGGHIHNKEGCHTLRWDTLTYWLPELSGDTEADAVEAYGEVLCSHCYPSAPVSWQNGKLATGPDGKPLTKAAQAEAQAAKEAEKAARQAAKDAKSVFVPGTRDLVLDADLREIKTERSLVTAIIDVLANNGYYPESLNRRSSSATKRDRKTREVIGVDESYPTYGEWLDYAYAALAAKHGQTVAEVKAELNKKLQARNARAGR